MRRIFVLVIVLCVSAFAAQAQGGSAASPTLKVGDGQRSFNGINELRVPAGCVTFSGRTAIINCTSGGSSGTSSSQNGNLFFASPNGAYGLPSWRAILEADLPSISASKIGSGIFAIGRLGSGTASSSTFLRGDSTWAALPAESVSSVFGRTGAVVAVTNDYTWAQINKATSSLADLTTRSASDLSSGTLATARLGTGTASSSTFLRGDQTWATPVTSITGTANQVIASAATGAVTLSLPQSIATTSGPQFATLGLNTSTPSTLNGTTFASTRFQTFNSTASSYFAVNTSLASGYAGVFLNRAGANANERLWSVEAQPFNTNTSSVFAVSKYTDAGAATGVFSITRTSNVVSGEWVALPTTATEGFLHIPTTPGVPTGVPLLFPGKSPLVIDSVNNKLCYYLAAWRCI